MWYTGSIHLYGQCNYERWTACKALERVSELSDLWTSEQLERSEGRQPTWLPEPGLPKTKAIGVSGPPVLEGTLLPINDISSRGGENNCSIYQTHVRRGIQGFKQRSLSLNTVFRTSLTLHSVDMKNSVFRLIALEWEIQHPRERSPQISDEAVTRPFWHGNFGIKSPFAVRATITSLAVEVLTTDGEASVCRTDRIRLLEWNSLSQYLLLLRLQEAWRGCGWCVKIAPLHLKQNLEKYYEKRSNYWWTKIFKKKTFLLKIGKMFAVCIGLRYESPRLRVWGDL